MNLPKHDGWHFEVVERSVGAYLVSGVHASGANFEFSTADEVAIPDRIDELVSQSRASTASHRPRVN